MSDEIYYIQVQGEHRGPYTRRQIDHQLNSGLISEATVFHREGMEDWAPITHLVTRRRQKRKWRFRGALVAFFCFLAVMARFFGPVAVEGWRETAQFQFTERAAYWRAREAVRHQALPEHALVKFASFEDARAVLDPATSTAQVRLAGDVTIERGSLHAETWEVALEFDSTAKQWTAVSVQERK